MTDAEEGVPVPDVGLAGALERVRRVACHLPVGPSGGAAPGDRQPPGGPDGAAEDGVRVVVRPT